MDREAGNQGRKRGWGGPADQNISFDDEDDDNGRRYAPPPVYACFSVGEEQWKELVIDTTISPPAPLRLLNTFSPRFTPLLCCAVLVM